MAYSINCIDKNNSQRVSNAYNKNEYGMFCLSKNTNRCPVSIDIRSIKNLFIFLFLTTAYLVSNKNVPQMPFRKRRKYNNLNSRYDHKP